ncbi:hypothetical protein EDB83DRAFT_2180280, partial [Lactarius deliciosus]
DQCLAKNHDSRRIKDMLKITDRLKGTYERGVHYPVFSCHCEDCTTDRNNGCENPQRCAIETKKRLEKITPKLNPATHPNRDSLTKTRRRETRTQQTQQDEDEDEQGIIFNPSVTEKLNLADCFRIFVDRNKISNTPATRQPPPRGITIPNENITVYTDGSCLNNGKGNARCGSGIWVEDGSDLNQALRVPGQIQSNQVGELAAVAAALEKVPNYTPLTIVTD